MASAGSMAARTFCRQLYLFDCDGGRSNLFDDINKLKVFPSNCELYLFWNDHDTCIDAKLNQLKENAQIHLCPSHLVNSKNAADGKLIYFLGKLVDEFSIIMIVHGGDEIYKEVVEAVGRDFPTKNVTLHEVNPSIPNELEKLIRKMHELNKENQYNEDAYQLVRKSLVDNLSSVQIKLSKKCPFCSKSLKTITGTLSHLMTKHSLTNNDIMTIGVKLDSPCLVPDVEISTAAGPIRCPHPACSKKKKRFKKKKDLEAHQKTKHPSASVL